MLCLRHLAAQADISSGMLASRADVTKIVLDGEDADVRLMNGWRRKVVGQELLSALDGNVTARIRPDSHRVHLDWNQSAEEK